MKAALTSLAVFVAALAAPFLTAAPAYAQEEVCVAIYPCDQNGDVLPPYDKAEGFCAEKFRMQCASVKANIVAEKLVQCETSRDSADGGYRKQIRKLRQKLRSVRK
ncbi:MAG: hypothetical protein J5J00_06865 [Deltaproteobacteria bacterium]|nr:hypothetical protein [Deltaproteobacteria bacterium]